MKPRNEPMRSLNRLKWLHAFEATARHGSFTRAAQELGVTPAAVGQLVRALESWVGHPLLHRSPSGKERLSLVDDAQEALQDITIGLDKLDMGLKKLRSRKSRSVVTVTASQVLVMHWFMERLNRFAAVHEGIDLRLNVTEKLMDVSHSEADVGIRCGQGDWPGVNKTWLMNEEAVLVCSPRLVPPEKTSCGEWLATQKLIHDETPHPGANFPSWDDVLMVLKAPTTRQSSLHINSTSAVILSALSGQGVALVRHTLVKQLISTGQLIQLHPDHRWPLRWSYYIVTPQQSAIRPEVQIFHDWLVRDTNENDN